jgi:hypothetical protein
MKVLFALGVLYSGYNAFEESYKFAFLALLSAAGFFMEMNRDS